MNVFSRRQRRTASKRTTALAAGAVIAGLAVTALGSGLVAADAATPTPTPTPTDSPRAGAVTPGPTAPKQLFLEDFENGTDLTPMSLADYASAASASYTADASWLDFGLCNGIITAWRGSDVAECNANQQIRSIANAIGQASGTGSQNTNHVLSAFTSGPATGSVQFKTIKPVPLSAAGRFITFGVTAGAMNCTSNHPLLDFALVDGTTEYPVSDTPIDTCSDAGVKTYQVTDTTQPNPPAYTVSAGRFTSKGAVLFHGKDAGIVLRNQQPSNDGNDGAIDDITILDATPSLSISAASGENVVGDSARLTFTVTNTSEKGAKPGWGFTESLPAGLTLAQTPNVATTCSAGTATGAAGATDIVVAGDLAQGDASCTVTADVTSTTPGTYALAPAGLTKTEGVDFAQGDDIVFAAEQNSLTLTNETTIVGGNGDDIADRGESIVTTQTVTNAGGVEVHDLAVTSDAGAATCDVVTLAPGAKATCSTAEHVVDQHDVDAGSIGSSATASAVSRVGAAVISSSAATQVATSAAAPLASVGIVPTIGGKTVPASAGDRVDLAVSWTNAGNVTLHDASVTLPSHPELTVSCPSGDVAPGETVDCTVSGTYLVTQADVDLGSLQFSGVVTAHTPGSEEVTSPTFLAKQSLTAAAPTIGAKLTTSLSTKAGTLPAVGDEIASALTLRNDGNVTIHGLSVSLVDRPGLAVTCPVASLAPGESVDCTVDSFALTQAGIEAGSVDLAVTVTGLSPSDAVVTTDTTSTVAVVGESMLSLTATPSIDRVALTGKVLPGDEVGLTFRVTNPGNLVVSDLAVATTEGLSVVCDITTLQPRQSTECATTTKHSVTQAEGRASRVSFVSSAIGSVARGDDAVSVRSGSPRAQDLRVEVRSDDVRTDVDTALPPIVPAIVTPVLAYTGSEGLGVLLIAMVVLIGLGSTLIFVKIRRRDRTEED